MKIIVMGSAMCPLNETKEVSRYQAVVGEMATPEILINRNRSTNVIDMTK